MTRTKAMIKERVVKGNEEIMKRIGEESDAKERRVAEMTGQLTKSTRLRI